jgi:hypothetical protein
MFNPFVLVQPIFIDRLIRLNKIYLVTQTYYRVKESNKTQILISDYEDMEYASIHQAALKDKYAAILHLTKPAHRLKLEQMLQPTSTYRLWLAILSNQQKVEMQINHQYKQHIKRFIQTQTNWRVGSDEIMRPQLECIFGELFITLKRGAQKIKVKLEDIEKS